MSLGWNGKWSKEELKILQVKYPVGGADEVIKYLPNRGRKAILSMAAKHKINQWQYNENYFEKIDSEEKAYWLGFIYADGYLSKTNLFGIELNICDLTHLEKLKQNMSSNMKIRIRQKESFGKQTETCIFELRNKKIAQDLMNNGIFPDKTHNIQIPNISDEYISDFIRGFFDGDGTYVLCGEYSKEVSCICACKYFLEWIKKDFDKNGIESHLNITAKENLYSLRIFKNESIQKYYNIYWKNAKIYLDRKKEKIEKIYNYCLLHSK